MPRVKRGVTARRRRNKVLERASGYYSSGSRIYTVARQMSDRGMVFAYRDRKVRKREFRSLWIQRINAAVRPHGLNYSTFMGAYLKSGLQMDRKSLSELAIHDAQAFSQIVKQVMAN
jgi:large subunit ribosomal protein L20